MAPPRRDGAVRAREETLRKALLAALVGLLAIAALLFLLRGSLAPRIMERVLERNLERDVVASLPDGLHLWLCGAGSPLPDPARSGPCAAVVAGPAVFVVDAGSGGARNLQRLGLPGAVRGVLLTHFHSDHIDGLGELGMLRWVGAGHTEPLPVYGPAGVEEVVGGFNRAYRLDAGYRTAHHGTMVAPPEGAGLRALPFRAPDDGTPVLVHEQGDLRITAFAVDHRPASPAVGYRFDYGGRALVISGDTVKSPVLAARARGADVLVHEALAPELVKIMNRAAAAAGAPRVERITHDILDYHTSPVEAAEIAAEAGVRALLLHHIVPPLPLPGLPAAFLRGVEEAWDGRIVLGEDGTLVTLPRDGTEVRFSRMR